MEFLNETLDKAKELFAVAKQKTDETVTIGKKKYEISVLEGKIKRLYTELGKNAFSYLAENGDLPPQIRALTEEIKSAKESLETQRAELVKMQSKRICPKCAAVVEDNSNFCNVCGEKLVYSEE